jgi:glycosyltransferase involved in cell wall biosynthesis
MPSGRSGSTDAPSRRDGPRLDFLIPTLNEEKAVGATIDLIRGIQPNLDYEITIVDGGSTDGTVSIARERGAKVIPAPRGYGRQYLYALDRLDCDYVITGDADATYPFPLAYRYLQEHLIRGGFEFLSTNRFADRATCAMGRWHRWGNRFLTLLTNALFGLHLRDSQSGMWIFRLDSCRKLRLRSRDMSFSEEIKIEAFRRLSRVAELPITYHERIGTSKLNHGHAVKNTLFLLRKALAGR